MRRWMLIFGLLDLGVVLTYATRVPGEFRGLASQPLLNAVCLLMMASLALSGIALIRGQHWTFYLNYLQFPVRLVLAFLSFSWLALLILPSQPSVMLNEAVWGTAVALEGIRLGVTVMLHVGRRGQQHNPPMHRTVPAV
jgi:hypothetical protein